ncbi:MAG: hypothetical protein WCZ66_01340 [Sphingomonadaceae bacterium]
MSRLTSKGRSMVQGSERQQYLDFLQRVRIRTLDLGVDMSRFLAGEVSDQCVPAKALGFREAE